MIYYTIHGLTKLAVLPKVKLFGVVQGSGFNVHGLDGPVI